MKLHRTILYTNIGVIVSADYDKQFNDFEITDVEVFDILGKGKYGQPISIIEALGEMSSEEVTDLYGIDWAECYEEAKVDKLEMDAEMYYDLQRENEESHD